MTIRTPEKWNMRNDADVIYHLWSIVLAGGGNEIGPDDQAVARRGAPETILHIHGHQVYASTYCGPS